MKRLYPTIFKPIEDGYFMVTVPDFPLHTQGANLDDALFMARDAIGLMGISNEDDGLPNPEPSDIKTIAHEEDEIVSLVDVDFTAYRAQNDIRAVRRTVSLPNYLNEAATRAGVNVSALLQNALKKELGVKEPKPIHRARA